MAHERNEYMASDLGISSHVVTNNGFLELQTFSNMIIT
jgi:hypothetical protein